MGPVFTGVAVTNSVDFFSGVDVSDGMAVMEPTCGFDGGGEGSVVAGNAVQAERLNTIQRKMVNGIVFIDGSY